MAKLSASERQKKIAEMLSDKGSVKVVDLVQHFNVSRETIRRDLNVLNERGTVKKWFGGAVSIHERQDFSIQALDHKMNNNAPAKQLICKKALELIPPRSSIFIDNGSTAVYFARLLKNLEDYTIISSSLPVINTCIGSANKIIVCGGMVDSLVMSAMGAPTIEFLKHLNTDIAILGSDGFKLTDGPTGNSFEYSQIKKIAISNAQTSIVLADSSKAAYSSMIQYAEWKDINYLVTDADIDADVLKKIESKTEVITVSHYNI